MKSATFLGVCCALMALVVQQSAAQPSPSAVCKKNCNFMWLPVCGSNARTYGNKCELDVATCKSNGAIIKAYDGECEDGGRRRLGPCDRGCGRIFSPVCGTNGRTYNNLCLLQIATCKSHGHIKLRKRGSC
eukprot:GHVS01036667.1.p2 GENE.GHVS01036667.1~~GHVS01036667.1.p2  ORF type:complete len:131 (+),score=11.36 GHVS01036667.1:169-561(+)